jgi:two-component system sensor histidine kinase EvgS
VVSTRSTSRLQLEPTKSDASGLGSVAAIVTYVTGTAKSNSVIATAPIFDAEQLKGFGGQATALAEALKSANLHDLDEAGCALACGDFRRLCELAHRMKGAALVIGATPFADACLALQRVSGMPVEFGYDVAAIHTAHHRFHDEAIALDTALEQCLASARNPA